MSSGYLLLMAQAVNEFATKEGLDDLSYGDYYYINHTNEIAALGGGDLFHFSLVKAREVAWNTAERLRKFDEPDEFLAYLDELVSVIAYLIVNPPAITRPLIWAGGLFEEKDPRIVTSMLLRAED